MTANNTTSPMMLLPLFDEEHWSLLVIFSLCGDGYTSYFLLDSGSEHKEYALTVLAALGFDALTEYRLPKKTPRQDGDWQCGHFVLMNAKMLVDFCRRHANGPTLWRVDTLRRHLNQEMLAASYRNIRTFARYVADIM